MMEDDNRVYYRARGSWRVTDPGIPLHETTADGWPPIDRGIVANSEIIVWRGKVIKDRWGTYDRAEFLEGIKGL
jgi:hypothetical protein